MTYPRSICAGEAITLMSAVVTEAGRDHTYPRRQMYDEWGHRTYCVMYVCGGEADCMFGRMLERFGVPCHMLTSSLHLPIHWVLARLNILCSPLLAYHLAMAQVTHDLSLPWGYVLDRFTDACMASTEAGARI